MALITTDRAFHFDATQLGLSDYAEVPQLTDISGHDSHFLNSHEAKAIFRAGYTTYGKPVVVFDGTQNSYDGYLDQAYYQPYTIFFVGGITSGVVMDTTSNTNTNRVFFARDQSDKWSFYAGNNLITATAGDASLTLITALIAGSGSKIYINGTLDNTSSNVGASGIEMVRIGRDHISARPYSGHIAEIIIYHKQLTTGEIDEVNDYLMTKWFTEQTGGMINYHNGSSFVEKSVKYWDGTSWIEKPMKHWTGAEWALTNSGGPPPVAPN